MLLRLSFLSKSRHLLLERRRRVVVLSLLLVRGRRLLLRLLLSGVLTRELPVRRVVLRVSMALEKGNEGGDSMALEEGRGRRQHGFGRGTRKKTAWL
jgi:hypothetical protein